MEPRDDISPAASGTPSLATAALMPAPFRSLSIVALVLGALSCDSPSGITEPGAQLAWLAPPPATLREGASATIGVELRDGSGQPLLTFDGAALTLRFTSAVDTQLASACGAACTTTVAQGRAQLTVGWVSAGTWTATACLRPAVPADSLCLDSPVTVQPVQAVLVTYPADSVGRRVRFPVEARLRLPDGTAVTDLTPAVRLRFTSAASAAGHVTCPEAGPQCERTPVAGVTRLDSVMMLDTNATTLEACVVAPNGHERCDPAGPRTFRVVLPTLTLRFVTEPGDGAAGVPFATQPVIEALEPDGTRRADFDGAVEVQLTSGAYPAAILAGTGLGGVRANGTVAVQAIAGLASFADLRVNLAGDAYSMVASTAGAAPASSAAFNIALDIARLSMSKNAGDDQYSLAGQQLPIAAAVLLTGPLGDSIAGVTVVFTMIEGGRGPPLAPDTTDETGIASSPGWTLSAGPGINRMEASVAGLDPVTFTAEGVVPTQLAFVTQPSDVVAGDTIRPAIVVELQDSQGRRVLRATTFVVLNVLGDLNTSVGRDAVDGRATFEDFSPEVAGWQNLQASTLPGDFFQASSTQFFVSPKVATAELVAVAGAGQSGTVGTAVDTVPIVRVQDVYSNPIPGRTVQFTTTVGGGSVTGGVQVTDADGQAHPDAWILGPVPGTNTLSAKADGLADSTVFFATGLAPSFLTSSISAGMDFTCATASTTNFPYCWGANTYSQLGEGTQTARSRPTQLAGGLLQLTQVSAGSNFACGLAATGAAFCWGNNWYGQLGIDTTDVDQHATPEAVAGGHTFQQLSAGANHVCALDTGGIAWCWGAGSTGALGGVLNLSATPQRVTSPLLFTQVDAGALHTCAIAQSGDIWCWGSNDYGQLGDNSSSAFSFVPVRVTGGRTYTQVSAGGWTTCGVSLGAVYCWGRNREGQVGNGTTVPGWELLPVPALGALGVTMRVAVGTTHTCALNSQGETYCWGLNANGELGDGTTTPRLTGVPTSGGVLFVAITAGNNHTCGLRQSGAAYCWGSNGSGRLGDGTLTQRTVPAQVVVP